MTAKPGYSLLEKRQEGFVQKEVGTNDEYRRKRPCFHDQAEREERVCSTGFP